MSTTLDAAIEGLRAGYLAYPKTATLTIPIAVIILLTFHILVGHFYINKRRAERKLTKDNEAHGLKNAIYFPGTTVTAVLTLCLIIAMMMTMRKDELKMQIVLVNQCRDLQVALTTNTGQVWETKDDKMIVRTCGAHILQEGKLQRQHASLSGTTEQLITTAR